MSYGKRAAHCKNLEWQVLNKKINSNSMELDKNNTLVLIQEWGVARRKCV